MSAGSSVFDFLGVEVVSSSALRFLEGFSLSSESESESESDPDSESELSESEDS